MKPLWKQMFDAAEQAAGPAMSEATSSEVFAGFAKTSSKISKDINRQLEAASREWLHLWNLPAAGDLQHLKRQIGSLENEIRSLHRENERFHREMLQRTNAKASPGAPGASSKPVDTDEPPADGPELEIAS